MNIKIANLNDCAVVHADMVVVVDVFRAFSTACYIFGGDAEDLIPINSIESAYKFKRCSDDVVLIGESAGSKPPGFDYNNSPSEIKTVSFKNKTVVLSTSCGTKGLLKYSDAETVITGSFVNFSAVLHYIMQKNPRRLCIICTNCSFKENEDLFFANYLAESLEDHDSDFSEIKAKLRTHACSRYFFVNDTNFVSEEDFDLCLDKDRFNFVLKLEKNEKGIFHLKKLQF